MKTTNYKEPFYGEPQLVWDIDNAITSLMTAAELIGNGDDAAAADALSLAVFSANEAIAKVRDAGYMATAFSAERIASDEAELMAVMGAAA